MNNDPRLVMPVSQTYQPSHRVRNFLKRKLATLMASVVMPSKGAWVALKLRDWLWKMTPRRVKLFMFLWCD